MRVADSPRPTPFGALDVPPPSVRRNADDDLAAIRRHNRTHRIWTLVLDDDPTGSQTVRDVPVLPSDHGDDDLDWASRHPSGCTFVLTNSRAVDAAGADRLTHDTIVAAARVARRRDLRLRVLSRSDSTLRGHFATEVQAAHRALDAAGVPAHGTVFAPAFVEAGRITSHDTQWVSVDGGYIPSAHSEFATDRTFGYSETDLLEWVDAQFGGHPRSATTSVSLEVLRSPDGVHRTATALRGLGAHQVAVVNAARVDDLQVLMLAVADLENSGRSVVIRCGPGMVRVCAGQPAPEPLDAPDLDAGARTHGLIAVGSHTGLTDDQVRIAVADHHLVVVDLDAVEVLHGADRADAEIVRASGRVVEALATRDVVLRTSRDVLHEGRDTPLAVSVAIGAALVQTVRRILAATPLRFLVAKGGITSSDLATDALGFRRAVVTGQMLRGSVPAWQIVEGERTGLPFIVFPGNVGSDSALSDVVGTLRGHGVRTPHHPHHEVPR